MAHEKRCDLCKRPTQKIVKKLLITPTARHGVGIHSAYSHHADIGECCWPRVLQVFNFRERKSQEEYNRERKKQAGMKKSIERRDNGRNTVAESEKVQKPKTGRTSRKDAGKQKTAGVRKNSRNSS